MDWLDTLRADMRRITRTAALPCWPPLSGCAEPCFDFRYEHVRHVEVEALKLNRLYGGDRDIVLAAVWTHDRTKFEPGRHAQSGADWVLAQLAGIGFPTEKVEAVAYAVREHSGWTKTGLDTTEARILWDADKLAHFGPAYFIDLMLRYTSPQICAQENRPDMPFHESLSTANYIERFKEFGAEIDPQAFEKTFYFEESLRLLDRYRRANKLFYETLSEQWR